MVIISWYFVSACSMSCKFILNILAKKLGDESEHCLSRNCILAKIRDKKLLGQSQSQTTDLISDNCLMFTFEVQRTHH
jgi:hypothetical protein